MTAETACWIGAIVLQPLFVYWLVGYWQRKRRPSWEREPAPPPPVGDGP